MDNFDRHIIQALVVLYLICACELAHAATINNRRSSRSAGDYPSWLNVVETDNDLLGDFFADGAAGTAPSVPRNQYNSDDDDDCPGCKSHRAQQTLSEQEIRDLKIEMIKKQILQKLRLTERPNITKPVQLPAPLLESDYDSDYQSTSAVTNLDTDDFYGQTTQAIVFGHQVSANCFSRLNKPTGCFKFELKDDVKGRDIVSAELWAFKRPDPEDIRNQTLMVSDFETRRHHRKHLIDDARTTKAAQWVRFDVTKTVSKRIKGLASHASFQITCKSCSGTQRRIPVSTSGKTKPFLVINLEKLEKRRSKRSQDCGGDTTNCCLEPFEVSFRAIGWSDWILQPSSYNANNCRGSCLVPRSKSEINSRVRQSIAMMENDPIRKANIVPCCSPSKMKSIVAIVTNPEGDIIKTTLPNMVIESCRCS